MALLQVWLADLRWVLYNSIRNHLPLGDLFAYVVFFAASVAFFYVGLTEGDVLYQDDSRVFYYPIMSVVADTLRQGKLLLWSPNMYGGYPLFADGEAGMLYPLNLLFFTFLPVETSFVWLRVAGFFLAALFTYHYALAIGCRRFGATIAGIVFMLSGFAVAQIVHTNLSQGAIWLPLILLFAEKAAQKRAGRRFLYVLLSGAAIAMQALAVHVQPLILSAMALVAYLAYRFLWESASDLLDLIRSQRPILVKLFGSVLTIFATPPLIAVVVGLTGLVGMGLAAVQLLPLFELSREAARGSGSPMFLATTNSVHPINLITLLVPRFFNLPNGDYWGLWVQWETTIYVGIPTLVLALMAIVFCRGKYVLFFAGLAVISMVLAFGKYSPIPLFDLFHDLPYMNVLRSPGRFSYLFTFALAILAGLGANWLDQRRGLSRTPRFTMFTIGLGLFAVAFAGYANAIADFIRANKDTTIGLIRQWYYLPSDEGAPFKPEEAYQFLLSAISGEQMAYSAMVLVACFVLLMSWRGSKANLPLLKAFFVALLLFDLMLAGSRFHPRLPIEDLSANSEAARFLKERSSDGRVYSRLGLDRSVDTQPNRLLALRIPEANGYSSLELGRHAQYAARVDYTENSLLDMWNVRYLLVRNKYVPLLGFESTHFQPDYPLLSSTSQNPNAKIAFDVHGERADEIRLVALLREAPNVSQGAEVARIILTDVNGKQSILPVRAGIDVADWAAGSKDAGQTVKHTRAKVALSVQSDESGIMVQRNYYYARLPVTPPMALSRVEFLYSHPMGVMQLYGLAMLNGEKQDVIQLRQRGKYRLVYKDKQVLIYENQGALPRAHVVPSVVIAKPGSDVLLQMAEGRFDPRMMVILEEKFDTSLLDEQEAEPQPNITISEWVRTRRSKPATVVESRSDRVVVRATAEKNSFLVLSDVYYPGWKAFLDGSEVKVFRANFLFRGVYLPKGEHIVEFRYEPASVALGGVITLAIGSWLLFSCAMLGVWWLGLAIYRWQQERQRFLENMRRLRLRGPGDPPPWR